MRNSRPDGTPLPHQLQKYSDYSSPTTVFQANFGRLPALELNRHLRSKEGVAIAKEGVASKNCTRFARILFTRNPPFYKAKSATVLGWTKCTFYGVAGCPLFRGF